MCLPAAALDAILESNGWEEKQLLESSHELCSMQMFLTNYDRIMCLHMFPALTSLQIIGQNIETIEGLEACTALSSLWIVEGNLEHISGLDHVTNLVHLYLYGNNISKISNISHLINLQTVWLAQNSIHEVSGLSTLINLRELNLARNPIETVPLELSYNSQLQVLNLSDTSILSCSSVSHLASLASLRELFLDDPNWGCAPVAKLANYQTMAIVQFPQLTVLDYLLISREASELAQSTFAKKRMFYNMRVKCCMQAMHRTEAAARQGLLAQQKRWYYEIEPCIRGRIHLENRLDELCSLAGTSQQGSDPTYEACSQSYRETANSKLAELMAVEGAVAATCRKLQVHS
jgi:Leucine-rich repeat